MVECGNEKTFIIGGDRERIVFTQCSLDKGHSGKHYSREDEIWWC
jgi:hypothetical protein